MRRVLEELSGLDKLYSARAALNEEQLTTRHPLYWLAHVGAHLGDTVLWVLVTLFLWRRSRGMGVIVAMPVLVYQIVAFIAPGLYPHEKRSLFLLLPGVMVLFFGGAAFANFVMLPVAVGFLQNFLGDVIDQEWTVDRYVGFFTRIVFWIGVAFETPLVIAFLARIGLVSGPRLLGMWRQAIVIISVVAAMITPTIDPINMTIVMLPLISLYFLGVGLAYLLYKPRAPRSFDEMDWGDDEE